jgi:multiple antibiotic resistance protein
MSAWKWNIAGVMGGIVLLAASAAVLSAQHGTPNTTAESQASFSIGKLFTFLFLTLGPFKIFGPFAAMTQGCDRAFKSQLAFKGIVIAALGMLVAATVGANTLYKWDISVGALQLGASIVLFLIALRQVLEQYEPKKPEPAASDVSAASSSKLAFSPLAFPTIVTPYGVAVLILIVTLRSDHLLEILGVTIFVLVLDFLAMVVADLILKTPLVAAALGILGSVMGVLQIALAVQASVDALRMMGIVAT